jgi:hypothetical protein
MALEKFRRASAAPDLGDSYGVARDAPAHEDEIGQNGLRQTK